MNDLEEKIKYVKKLIKDAEKRCGYETDKDKENEDK